MDMHRKRTGITKTFGFGGEVLAEYKSSVRFLDGTGQVVAEKRYNGMGWLSCCIEFNATGKVVKETYYEPDENINYTYEYKYNEIGKELEQRMFLAGKEYHGKWLNRYDNNGLLVGRDWQQVDGDVEVSEKLMYDVNGFLINKQRGSVAEWEYFYDEKGMLVRVVGGYFSAVEPEDVQYSYDDENTLVEELRFYQTGNTKSKTSYYYDECE